MSERDAFIRQICEQPDDDTARLVFADWLDEREEPLRADYIRRGIALAHPESLAPGHDMGGSWDAWDGTVDIIGQFAPQDPNHCPLCRAIQDERSDHLMRRALASEVGLVYDLPADWSGRADPGIPVYVGVRLRRGFASRIGLSLAHFCGDTYAADRTRRAFEAFPVEGVLLDRKPLPFEGRWLWHNHDNPLADTGDESDHLPAFLFLALDGFIDRGRRVNELVRSYPSHRAALDALSRVCVAYGRKLAKLPAWEPRKAVPA